MSQQNANESEPFDLLSAALSESGLEAFFSNDASTSSSSEPKTLQQPEVPIKPKVEPSTSIAAGTSSTTRTNPGSMHLSASTPVFAASKPVRFVKILPGGGGGGAGNSQSPIVLSAASGGLNTTGKKMALDVLIDSKTGKKIFKLTPSSASVTQSMPAASIQVTARTQPQSISPKSETNIHEQDFAYSPSASSFESESSDGPSHEAASSSKHPHMIASSSGAVLQAGFSLPMSPQQRAWLLKSRQPQHRFLSQLQPRLSTSRSFSYSSPLMVQQSLLHSPVAAVSNSSAAAAKKQQKSRTFSSEFLNDLGQKAINDLEEYEDELGFADTYSEYVPAKLRSGLKHPDPVVETASLSSVLPPDVNYVVSIPEEIVDTGQLSALQLEAIIYACQKHDSSLPNGDRCGYLIGDGAGVGKGRTIAGLIYENYSLGRKRALWFSVSTDLKFDAERDLKDIGANRIKVFSLNKLKYAKISGKENGKIKKGVLFSTYASLIGESHTAKSKYNSRFKQILHWCGRKFDGIIVFDECHRAKNLIPSTAGKSSKTGQLVVQLQKALPNARVIYASATGATEPRHMAYMTRLGLWGEGMPFKEFSDFIAAVERRGVGAMEIVAMDMKLRGIYLARQLSFKGVTFQIDEVPLSPEFIDAYDSCVQLWLEAREKFQRAAEMSDSDMGASKTMWSQFWSAHQRFFKYFCIAAKVQRCVEISHDAVRNGKCVVIGLQSTGEARTLEQLDEQGGELNEFVSTAKSVLQSLIQNHFPVGDTEKAFEKAAAEFSKKYDPDEDMRPKRAAAPRRRYQKPKFFLDDLKKESNDSKMIVVESPPPVEEIDLLLASDEEKGSGSEVEGPKSEKESEEEEESSSSSSSSSESEKESESEEEKEKKLKGSDDEEEGEEEEEGGGREEEDFNPFEADTAEEDLWAGKQKIVADDDEESKSKKKMKKKKKKRKMSEDGDDSQKSTSKKNRTGEAAPPAATGPAPSKRIEYKGDYSSSFGRSIQSSVSGFYSHTTSAVETGYNYDIQFNQTSMMRAELLAKLENLSSKMPPNTLDQLIDLLGGPDQVAEMTGRKGRIVSNEDGSVNYELRYVNDAPLEMLNMAEKERFMSGQKQVAIISEAASSGISLQADRRAQNQRRRVHVTLELPWSADKAIQQFGRTHRSNQVSAPEYVFLISELAGEQRFASIVAKRLESLGALTHGDRRATESRDFSQFHLDNKYGRTALETTMRSILGQVAPLVPAPVSYGSEHFFKDMQELLVGVGLFLKDPRTGSYLLEKDSLSMSKFLNRILGLPVRAQNALFQYFSETLKETVSQAKKDGRFDMGILDLGAGDDLVKRVKTQVFIFRRVIAETPLKAELHTVQTERGLRWDPAMEIYMDHSGDNDGFYVATSSGPNQRPTVILIHELSKKRIATGERLFNVFRPNTGLNPRMETLEEIKKKFKKALPDQVMQLWKELYLASSSHCYHVVLFGRCRNEAAGQTCDYGRRTRTYHILSGAVLHVWNIVESLLVAHNKQAKLQCIRVRTDAGQKIVGLQIPASCLKEMMEKLLEQSVRSYTEDHRTPANN